MASEYSVKKANHRQQMEMMDRAQKNQVSVNKDKHKQAMSELRSRHVNEKTELQQSQKNQLETVKQKNDSFVQSERINHQGRLENQKLQEQKDYQKAANEKARENARLRQEAQVEKERNIAMKDQSRKSTQEVKIKTERNLEQMDKEGQFRLKQKQAQLQEREKSIQAGHNNEVQRIEQQGQSTIKERRDKYRTTEFQQKEQHQEALQKNQTQFRGVKERQHNYYHKQLDKDEQFFQDQIKDQRKEYTKRYNENDKFNKASFENQDNRLSEEMFKLKKEFVSTAQFYDDRKQDPFYSLVDFGADFTEGEAHYEVTAKIPEHEMKNVRVHIQPNKISLHATRQHEQEFKADNEKIGSNIAQTIRQEFEMTKPAEHEKAIQTFKDGTLKVVVPKKGYFKFGMG